MVPLEKNQYYTNESYNIKNESIKKSVGKKPITYKTHKRALKTIAIATALATVLSVSAINNIADKVEDISNTRSVNSSINRIVAPEKRGSNILSKYSYIVNPADGTYAYNLDGIAKEIIHMEATYFDLTIYNIYSYMQERNRNIDDLFFNINFAIDNIKESNPEVYYKMKDINTFEDYLRKLKFVDENNNVSVEKYETYGNTLNELYKDIIKEESKGMSK